VADDAQWRAAIEAVLAGTHELTLAFQPVVDLTNGSVVGYEALSRFAGPPDATPDVWFAAADRLGLGAELEAHAVRLALARRHELPANCFLAINVSPHLLHAPPVWSALTGEASLGGIVIEFTEHETFAELDELRAHADELRRRGAVVALDDTGSGYAGLQQLVELRPELVKLDRSMVTDVDRDMAKLGLAELLGELAGRLNAWLLAEGVERREELAAFVELGVPLAQGWVFGKPGPSFADIDPQASEMVRELATASTTAQPMITLVEPAPWSQDLVAPAMDELARDDAVRVVVTDDHRPTHLVLRDPRTGRFSTEVVTLTTLRRASPTQVLQAALARPPAARFDPVVCTDDTGRYLGVVRVDRLAAAAASAASYPLVATSPRPPTAPDGQPPSGSRDLVIAQARSSTERTAP
jgi:EAL domain-containing protein (putative c-di-GMP-specific phosphodiesterase class I)